MFTASIVRKRLWNFGQFLPDYRAHHLRRQSSSYLPWEPESHWVGQEAENINRKPYTSNNNSRVLCKSSSFSPEHWKDAVHAIDYKEKCLYFRAINQATVLKLQWNRSRIKLQRYATLFVCCSAKCSPVFNTLLPIWQVSGSKLGSAILIKAFRNFLPSPQ
jgi:hypothetical protein